MVTGRIALVLAPIVVGILLGNAIHILVTMGLGQDRSSGNVGKATVALHKAGVGNLERRAETVAVDGQELRSRIEPCGSQRHPLERGVEDVDLVDALRRDCLHRPSDGLTFDDGAQQVALPLGELLRIIEQRMRKVGRQDDGGRKDRPGQTTTPRLVTPRLQKVVLTAKFQHLMWVYWFWL